MSNIDETELARLEALAVKAKPGAFAEKNLFNSLHVDGYGNDNAAYIAAISKIGPALVAEVRRLRAEAKQGGIDYCALMDRHDAQFVRAEYFKKQVEDLQWFVECFDKCKQRGKLPLEVHKTPSAYSEAWASLWAAREDVHADRA